MPYQKLTFSPGIYKDDSPLKAEGFFIDANNIRFVNGLPETVYGNELASSSTLLGVCRSAFTWADNTRNKFASFGTHLRLYVMDVDGTTYDITPVSSYSGPGQVSISFTTENGKTTVTADWTGHGLSVGQKFKLENASVATIGGVTIDGTYVVLTADDDDTITFEAADAATSSEGPTASSVDTTIYLAPGLQDGLDGAGFGTGGFGSGNFGAPSSTTVLYPRTYSHAQWGQNMLSSPRGGGLYEWAPNLTSSELVTNGNFSIGSDWTLGGGFTIGSGELIATAGSATAASQTITLKPGAWHLLSFTASIGAGTLLPTHGTSSIGSAASTSGLYRQAFFSNGGDETLALNKDTSFAGKIDNVSVQVLTTAQLVTGAPTQIGSMFVTAERIVVACGSNLDDVGTGTTDYNPLQLDWSDAEDNQNFAPTDTNLAGGYTLPHGVRIVRGLPASGENLIWTETSLWSMRYNADPNRVYDFVEIGSECGLMGPNAAAQVGGVWYWMTPTGAIMRYAGSVPTLVPTTLGRDLKDNLAFVQQDKVFAHSRVGKNYAEVWWRIPDSRDGSEVSRYVILDTIGGTWSCGIRDRGACAEASVFEFPIAVGLDGRIWFEEKGFSDDGGTRTAFLEQAYNSRDGGQIVLNGIRPDADDFQGGWKITPSVKFRDVRGIQTRTHIAMNITPVSGQKSCRVKGEQIKLRHDFSGSPMFWRMGATSFDVLPSSAKR